MSKLFALDGKVFDEVLVGADDDGCVNDDGTCCGCRRSSGAVHIPGCDWEPCPRCGGQMIACDCEREAWPGYSAENAQEIVTNLSKALEVEAAL